MRHTILISLAALALLSACGNDEPQTINLERTLIMSDEEGRKAGVVVLRPLGNGEIRDNSGRIIGVVSAPTQ